MGSYVKLSGTSEGKQNTQTNGKQQKANEKYNFFSEKKSSFQKMKKKNVYVC